MNSNVLLLRGGAVARKGGFGMGGGSVANAAGIAVAASTGDTMARPRSSTSSLLTRWCYCCAACPLSISRPRKAGSSGNNSLATNF